MQLLTEQDVVSRTKLSKQTLRNWRCLGIGPRYVKLSRAVRYPEEAVNEYLTKRTVEPRNEG